MGTVDFFLALFCLARFPPYQMGVRGSVSVCFTTQSRRFPPSRQNSPPTSRRKEKGKKCWRLFGMSSHHMASILFLYSRHLQHLFPLRSRVLSFHEGKSNNGRGGSHFCMGINYSLASSFSLLFRPLFFLILFVELPQALTLNCYEQCRCVLFLLSFYSLILSVYFTKKKCKCSNKYTFVQILGSCC